MINHMGEGRSLEGSENEGEIRGEKPDCAVEPGLRYLSKRQSRRIRLLLQHRIVVVYSISDLRQAKLSVRHHFELTDDRFKCARSRRMTSAHLQLVRGELARSINELRSYLVIS